MAGAAVGRGVGQAHALDAARVVSGEFLALDRHRQIRVAVLLAQALGAHAQVLAEPLALAGDFRRPGQRFGGTEFQFDTAGLLFCDCADLVEFHRRGNGGAEGNGIYPVLVADEIGVGQRIDVVHPGIRTQRPGRLVFQAARCAPVLRLVLNGEMAAVDGGDAPAGDGAAETTRVGDQVGLAVAFPRLVHGLSGNLACALELHFAHVAGRHGADLVDDVHQHLGAVGGQSLSGNRVLGQDLLAGIDRLHECARILDVAYALGASHGNGLQVLGGHDRADAGAAGRAVQVVDDRRVQATLLRGAAHGGDAQQRVLVFLVQPLIRRPDRLPPDIIGRGNFDLVIFHVQVHGTRRFAFKDDHVVARGL